MTTILSFFLAIVAGFALKKAGLCMVHAVCTFGTRYQVSGFVGLIKVVTWGWLLIVLVMLVRPEVKPLWSSGFDATIGVFIGGLIFGFGAAVNGACIFSTLTQLGEGKVAMLLTIAGVIGGLMLHTSIQAGEWLYGDQFFLLSRAAPTGWSLSLTTSIVPILLLGLWGIREMVSHWFSVSLQGGVGAFVLPISHDPKSGVIAIFGLAAGSLVFFYPLWSYPMIIDQIIDAAMGQTMLPELGAILITPAMLLGIFMTAISRRCFRLEWRFQISWLANGIGGLLMGFGLSVIPGDNLHLLMHALLGLSPHALPALMAMVVGIFAGTLLKNSILRYS